MYEFQQEKLQMNLAEELLLDLLSVLEQRYT